MKTIRTKYTSYCMFGIEIFSRKEDEITAERSIGESNQIEDKK